MGPDGLVNAVIDNTAEPCIICEECYKKAIEAEIADVFDSFKSEDWARVIAKRMSNYDNDFAVVDRYYFECSECKGIYDEGIRESTTGFITPKGFLCLHCVTGLEEDAIPTADRVPCIACGETPEEDE